MGDARRKKEACTCPLVSVTEVPPIDPQCPAHGAGVERIPLPPPNEHDFRAMPTRISARRAGGSWELYEKTPVSGEETVLFINPAWVEIYRLGRTLVKLIEGREVPKQEFESGFAVSFSDRELAELQRAIDAPPPLPPAVPLPPVSSESLALTRHDFVPVMHWNDEQPDPGAFRCPHCGAWRPGYGFNAQHATMPGMGIVDYITMYCGECRVIIQIQILAMDPAGVGGRGFRTH